MRCLPPDTDPPGSKRQRVVGTSGYIHQQCSGEEEARVMSMYLHRSMQQLSQLNADLSVLWPIIQSKQFLNCREHGVGPSNAAGLIAGGLPNQQQAHQQEQTQLIAVYEELLRLKGTVEAIFGQHISISMVSTSTINAMTVADTFRVLQSALDTLQQQLCRPPSADEVKTHTGTVLERLWAQSRLAAEEEMRAKLYMWKYKALDLKESLRATIERRKSSGAAPATATPSDSTSAAATTPESNAGATSAEDARTLSVLTSALEFVSSLHLLEVVNEPDSSSENLRKERAMTETATALSNKIHELQLARRAGLVAPAPSFASGAAQSSVGQEPFQSSQHHQQFQQQQQKQQQGHDQLQQQQQQPQRYREQPGEVTSHSSQRQEQASYASPVTVAAPANAFDPSKFVILTAGAPAKFICCYHCF